jgi:predicted Zn-dependent protease
MITGDVGSASSMAAALPTLLAQAKYSRQFETEADDFSVTFMQQQGLDTRYVASILQRLGEKYGDNDTTGYLDSHPATVERVQRLTGG